jgi:hypothetical protein
MVSYSPKYIEYLKETYEQRSYIRKPEFICKYCNAMFWYSERNKKGTNKNKEPMYSNCCKNGTIKIPKYREPPAFILNLLQNKIILFQNISLKKIDNIIVCFLLHPWVQIL